jgi:hypothetical protein
MERRIIASQAVVAPDGSVGLALTLDDGTVCTGELDLRVIAALRQQLATCEAVLRSGTEPAQ